MLDIKFIRENTELVKKGVARKRYDPKFIDELLAVDEERKKLQLEVENLRAQKNKAAKEKDIKLGKKD